MFSILSFLFIPLSILSIYQARAQDVLATATVTFDESDAYLLREAMFPSKAGLGLPGFYSLSGNCGYTDEFSSAGWPPGIRVVFEMSDDYECSNVITASITLTRRIENAFEGVEIGSAPSRVTAVLRDLPRVVGLRSVLGDKDLKFSVGSSTDRFYLDCSNPIECLFVIERK